MIVVYNPQGLGEDPGLSSRLRMELIKQDLLAPKVTDPLTTTPARSAAEADTSGEVPDSGMAASAGGLLSTRNLAILAALGAAYWFFIREKPKASSPAASSSPAPVAGLGRRSRRPRRR